MSYSNITNHWLDGAEKSLTPNKSSRPIRGPRFIVVHYTAGPSLNQAVETFQNPKRQASAHLVIGTEGKIVQMADFQEVTWHAGKSYWKPKKGAGRILGLHGLNNYSIGIELVNAGPIRRSVHGLYYTWWGEVIKSLNDVYEVDPREPESFGRALWHRYQDDQIKAATMAIQTICSTYPIEDILAHSDIAPGRKTDPGPAFPLNHIKSTIFGRLNA